MKTIGNIGLNEFKSLPTLLKKKPFIKNKKKHPVREKNKIFALTLISFLLSAFLLLAKVSISRDKENKWLNEPKNPKVTNVKQTSIL